MGHFLGVTPYNKAGPIGRISCQLEIQKIRDWTTTYVVTVTDCITILPINTLFVTIGGRLDVIGWD